METAKKKKRDIIELGFLESLTDASNRVDSVDNIENQPYNSEENIKVRRVKRKSDIKEDEEISDLIRKRFNISSGSTNKMMIYIKSDKMQKLKMLKEITGLPVVAILDQILEDVFKKNAIVFEKYQEQMNRDN